MADSKISELTAYTTPQDADVLPIVDTANATTKKIAMSSIFPSSATDNAIARFDGTTGKLIQNSGVNISDISGPDGSGIYTYTISLGSKTGKANQLVLRGGDSSDENGADTYYFGGNAGTNKTGGLSAVIGGNGNGSGNGGAGQVRGGVAGATGAGGSATVQGGAGGATSGGGGNVSIVGGSGTAGNSSGGSIFLAPGNQAGSGGIGHIYMYPYNGATYGAYFNLDSIASSEKGFTFPNESGTFALRYNTLAGFTVYGSTNVGGNNGLVVGSCAKDATPSGGQGEINITTNEAANQLNGFVKLVSSATTTQRYLNIGCVEQGVAYRPVAINADGGALLVGGGINFGIDNESTDTYVISLTPALTAYTTGMEVLFKAKTANTGAASININGLGAKTIVKAVSTTLANNDILAGMFCKIVYDGTNFVLLNPRAL